MWRWSLGLLACVALQAQSPRELFAAHCAGCHGPAGEGSRGPALKVVTLQRANDVDSLVALLRRGVPGTEMPPTPPETIADQPLRGLANYVLGLRTVNRNPATGKVGRGEDLFRVKG